MCPPKITIHITELQKRAFLCHTTVVQSLRMSYLRLSQHRGAHQGAHRHRSLPPASIDPAATGARASCLSPPERFALAELCPMQPDFVPCFAASQ